MLHTKVHPAIALVAIGSTISLFWLVTSTSVQASSDMMRNAEAQSLRPVTETEAQFRLRMRAAQAKERMTPVKSSSSVSSSLAPCAPVSSVASSATSSIASSSITSIADLTLSQLDTLRLQIRTRVCPVHGDPGYMAICRKLLETELKRNPRPELKGAVNPDQAKYIQSSSSSR
ncbi:MAG: hypothetical protein KBD00_04040 [Candidatus Peribacteraceae bacterium]|nr:hypothetical protein [Candidatus Peribacteraceae bacterium]